MFISTHPGGFFHRHRFKLFYRLIAAPPLFVRNEFQSVVHAVSSRFYPAVFNNRTFGIYLPGSMRFELVLNTIPQRTLIGLELYDKIALFLSDFIDNVLLTVPLFTMRPDKEKNINIRKKEAE